MITVLWRRSWTRTAVSEDTSCQGCVVYTQSADDLLTCRLVEAVRTFQEDLPSGILDIRSNTDEQWMVSEETKPRWDKPSSQAHCTDQPASQIFSPGDWSHRCPGICPLVLLRSGCLLPAFLVVLGRQSGNPLCPVPVSLWAMKKNKLLLVEQQQQQQWKPLSI